MMSAAQMMCTAQRCNENTPGAFAFRGVFLLSYRPSCTAAHIIFAPIFFASIGLKTDISGLTPEIFLFCVCFVIVALITKIIGCGLAAKICRFNWGDSLKIGVGMMTRGEVALIVAQKGLDVGVVDSVYFTAVILLIVVSSVATPLVLKALFTKMPPQKHPSQVNG